MINRDRLIALLADLVRIDSTNPDLVRGGAGEGAIARFLEGYCRAAGLETQSREVAPGRPNVIARLRGRGMRPGLILNGHVDTVAVEGMAIDPFGAEVRDGRLYGRGAYDMKGGIAAMIEGVLSAGEQGHPLGDVVLTMVADEEYASLGTQAIVRDIREGRLDSGAAIVTESTALDVVIAHRGFAWITIETRGRAAHGSRFMDGVDAIVRMGRVLAELERLERDVLRRRTHPLVKRPSLHAALIEGGTGWSTYADRCRVCVERRTLPSETEEDVKAEVEELLTRLRLEDRDFEASSEVTLFRPGLEVPAQSVLVRSLGRSVEQVTGASPSLRGELAWLDSALLGEAGVPTVIFGPGGQGAHADVEWVDIDSVATASETLRRFILEWDGRA